MSSYTKQHKLIDELLNELEKKERKKKNLCTNDLLPRAVIWWCTSDLLVSSAGCDISSPSCFTIDKYLHRGNSIVEQIHAQQVHMQKNTEKDTV